VSIVLLLIQADAPSTSAVTPAPYGPSSTVSPEPHTHSKQPQQQQPPRKKKRSLWRRILKGLLLTSGGLALVGGGVLAGVAMYKNYMETLDDRAQLASRVEQLKKAEDKLHARWEKLAVCSCMHACCMLQAACQVGEAGCLLLHACLLYVTSCMPGGRSLLSAVAFILVVVCCKLYARWGSRGSGGGLCVVGRGAVQGPHCLGGMALQQSPAVPHVVDGSSSSQSYTASSSSSSSVARCT
jgi:hypothetical protein